jgi:lamin B
MSSRLSTSSSSSATARARHTSPSNGSSLNISRAQEKEQLETLNNRLAVYIDTVRRLEQDNKELRVNTCSSLVRR